MSEFTRRSVLRSVVAGTAALSVVGVASAGGSARYLVSGRGGGLRRRLEREGFSVEHALADDTVLVVHGPDGATGRLQRVRGVEHAAMDVLFKLERPEQVEPAEMASDEEFFPLQWDKQVTDVPAAHETATGAGRTIAVIDTGVDDDHPDLPNRTGPSETMNGLPTEVEFHDELDADGNIVTTIRTGTGSVRRPKSLWFASANEVLDDDCNLVGYVPTILNAPATHPVATDVVDHGTHVAGIAAGSDDGTTGIVGTAPDATAVPIRVFNWITEEVDTDGDDDPDTTVVNTLASFTSIFLAIDYASRLGVDAMNLSIGTPPLPPQVNAGGIRGVGERVVHTATRRGSVVVVSAGNSGVSLQQGGFFTLPNSLAGAMSISATGPNSKRVFYSNFGTNEVDVGAPGGGYETLDKTLCANFWDPSDDDAEVPVFEDVDDDCVSEIVEFKDCTAPEWPFPTNLVLSTVPPEFWGGGYAYFAGTSMAAPQVTGTAALVREVAPDANPNKVEKAIEQGAESVAGEGRDELGAGRLNVADALESAVVRRGGPT